jgi:hypothetical protein
LCDLCGGEQSSIFWSSADDPCPEIISITSSAPQTTTTTSTHTIIYGNQGFILHKILVFYIFSLKKIPPKPNHSSKKIYIPYYYVCVIHGIIAHKQTNLIHMVRICYKDVCMFSTTFCVKKPYKKEYEKIIQGTTFCCVEKKRQNSVGLRKPPTKNICERWACQHS